MLKQPALIALVLHVNQLSVSSTPVSAPMYGNCTNISSTGFSVLSPSWPGNSDGVAGYVGLFRNESTPLSRPSALLLAQLFTSTGGGGRASTMARASAIALLQPATTYTLRWRFRQEEPGMAINFGFGWGDWGQPFECTTLSSDKTSDGKSWEVSSTEHTFNHAVANVTAVTRDDHLSPPFGDIDGGGVGINDRAGGRDEKHHQEGFGGGGGGDEIHRDTISSKTIRLYRSSEFTVDDVDFLSNHSSGDERAEATLLTGFDNPSHGFINTSCIAALEARCRGLRYLGRSCLACAAAHLPMPECGTLRPPEVNVSWGSDEAHFYCGVGFPSFNWQSPLAEYTVDYLEYVQPGAAPSTRDPGFVPYTSCDAPNAGFANSPLRPLCICQVEPDRRISRLNDTAVVCPPNGTMEPDGGKSPACNCTLAYKLARVTEEETLRHIGQGPVYYPLFPSGDPPWPLPPSSNRFGSFFSTGVAGECALNAVLGDRGCTWKMRHVVRVISYAELAAAGFNDPNRPSGLAGAEANVAAFATAWRRLDAFVKPAPS